LGNDATQQTQPTFARANLLRGDWCNGVIVFAAISGLFVAVIFSMLDYCNSVFAGTMWSMWSKLFSETKDLLRLSE